MKKETKFKINSVKDNYNRIAELYGKEFGTFIEDIDVYQEFEKYLDKDSYILDLGAGTGRTYKYFNSKGYKYTGLDISINMKKEAYKIHGKFNYICDNMLNIKKYFENDSIDGVFALYSLFHIPQEELANLFKNIYDILKDNGVLLLSYQEGAGEDYIDEPYLKENGKKVLYMNYISKEKISGILNLLGFKIVYIKNKIEEYDNTLNTKNNITTFIICKKVLDNN